MSKSKQKEYQQKHYHANREVEIAKAYQRTQANKQKLRERIAQAKRFPCTDCGIRYPNPVMEFDHVRGKKECAIANAVNRNFSLKRLEEELAKCELVCANCHRLRHCALEELANSPDSESGAI